MSVSRMNRSALLGCMAVASCLLTSVPAVASPTFYSTGTHISNGLDMDWWVSTGYGSFDNTHFVQANQWVHGSESWITDAQSQQWQYFTFRQYFDLTGGEASTAKLKFYWGCDDLPQAGVSMPVFSVNGAAFQGADTCSGYVIGTNLVTLDTGFVEGSNYIDFRVQGNYATNGMGLTVVSFTADSGTGNNVPEPGTLALALGSLAGLGLARRARKQG